MGVPFRSVSVAGHYIYHLSARITLLFLFDIYEVTTMTPGSLPDSDAHNSVVSMSRLTGSKSLQTSMIASTSEMSAESCTTGNPVTWRPNVYYNSAVNWSTTFSSRQALRRFASPSLEMSSPITASPRKSHVASFRAVSISGWFRSMSFSPLRLTTTRLVTLMPLVASYTTGSLLTQSPILPHARRSGRSLACSLRC